MVFRCSPFAIVVAIYFAICTVGSDGSRVDNRPCFYTRHHGKKWVNCTKLTLQSNGFNDLNNVPLILKNMKGSVNVIWLYDLSISTLTKKTFDRSNGNIIEDLKELGIIKSKIQDIEPDTFNQDYLYNLEKLILSENNLIDLKDNSFTGLSQLKYLNLNENKLKNLTGSSIFAGLMYLEEINLSSNELNSLGDNLFVNNQNLKQIDLSNNRFQTINAAFVINNFNLKIFIVNGNPWNCTAIEDVMFQIFRKNLYDTKSLCGASEGFKEISWIEHLQSKVTSNSDETRNNCPNCDTSITITLLVVIIVILLVFGVIGGFVYLRRWRSNEINYNAVNMNN